MYILYKLTYYAGICCIVYINMYNNLTPGLYGRKCQCYNTLMVLLVVVYLLFIICTGDIHKQSGLSGVHVKLYKPIDHSQW